MVGLAGLPVTRLQPELSAFGFILTVASYTLGSELINFEGCVCDVVTGFNHSSTSTTV